MNKKTWVIGLLFLGVCVGGYTQWQQRKTPAPTATISRGAAVQVVYATGAVESATQATLAPLSSGRITALFVNEGEAVKQGQILAQLNDEAEQHAVQELTAKQALATIALTRARALRAKNAGSQETLDAAQSSLDQSAAQRAQAEEKLALRKIISPFNGTIVRRDGDVGEMVAAGTQLFIVADLSALRVSLEVDEDDIPLIQTGQKVLLTSDAYMGQAMAGTVSSITPFGDQNNKVYRVRASLPAETPLKLGMTVEANIVTKEAQNVLLVPSDAIHNNTVTLKTALGQTEQPVKVGIIGAEKTEILEGVQENDTVILPIRKKAN